MRRSPSLPVAVAGCLALALAGCSESPTGRSRLTLVPEAQMDAIGESAFAQLRRELPPLEDAAATSRVACIARAITAVLPDHLQQDWRLAVFDVPQANAFALPSGDIGVHAGMLEVARDQDRLAAVIAHEVAHVLARHGNERLSTELAARGLLQLAALLIGAEADVGDELLLGALGLGAQYGVLLPFSRVQESEADIVGLELMAAAGFDPRGAVLLWQDMRGATGGQPPEFLSTHPSHGSRIEDLQARMASVLPIMQRARDSGRRPACDASG